MEQPPDEVVQKFLLQGLECYTGTRTQMKTHHRYDKYGNYWCDLEVWLRWSFKVIGNDASRLVCQCNCSSILHHFQVI